MKQLKQRGLSLLITLVMLLGLTVNASAAVSDKALEAAIQDTAAYMYQTVSNPQVGSTGGEWAIIGLARSGEAVPQSWYDTYYKNLENYVLERNGQLHAHKYTEYSRVILALTAIGKDPHSVAGYDLTKPLGDFDKTIWQGINGPIWALIALDSGRYDMPVDPDAKIQATREMYVDYILSREEKDGGWALVSGRGDDADVTGMALQALAKYTDRADVRAAVDRALARLSALQNGDGSFSASATFGAGIPTCESTAQVVVALTELGVSLDDSRFIKNGRTVLDALLSFYTPGKGFVHTGDGGGVDGMATEQGLYALAAAKRAMNGMNTLYDMTPEEGDEPVPDIPDISFSDVSKDDWFYDDVAFAVHKGLFGGVGDGRFAPLSPMTREMLATVLYRLDGEPAVSGGSSFGDAAAGQWYTDAVIWANRNKIIEGYPDTKFGVGDNVTREQMALMLMRYAVYKGYDTSAAADLRGYGDAGQISSYAREAMEWAVAEGLLTGKDGGVLDPGGSAARCEVAAVIHRFCDKLDRKTGGKQS